MFSKVLETAILQLQAVAGANATTDAGANTPEQPAIIDQANQTPTNPTADLNNFNDQMAYYSSFAVQIAAFIYLGLGLAYAFFGARFVKIFISLLSGLLGASLPFIFVGQGGQISTGLTIASIAIFALVAFGCYRLERAHSAILGLGVGSYVGSIGWNILLSYFTPPYTKYTVEFIAAVICAHYGYKHPHQFMTQATAFLGGNMIATSITLFTADAAGPYGNFGIQVACILFFGIVGNHVQHKLEFNKEHDEHHRKLTANQGGFLEHHDEKLEP